MKKLFLLTSVAINIAFIGNLKAEMWDCGDEKSSVICTLQNDGTLIVSGTGNIKDYYTNNDTGLEVERPWEDKTDQIKKIIISEGVTRVGAGAFKNLQNLESIYIPDSVESLGNWAFQSAGKLKSISIPNAVIAASVFAGSTNLEFAQFKDNAMVGSHVFDGTKIPSCSNKHTSCGICNDYVKSGLGCVKDCGVGYLGKEGKCIDASLGCGAGYRQFENFCNHVHWTPADAAKVLRDDNTNEVTITFKK